MTRTEFKKCEVQIKLEVNPSRPQRNPKLSKLLPKKKKDRIRITLG